MWNDDISYELHVTVASELIRIYRSKWFDQVHRIKDDRHRKELPIVILRQDVRTDGQD